MKVQVEPNSAYQLEGADVVSFVEVSIMRAALGGVVSVQSLRGAVLELAVSECCVCVRACVEPSLPSPHVACPCFALFSSPSLFLL